MIEVIHVTKTRGDDGQDFILRQTEKNHHMSCDKSKISRSDLFRKKTLALLGFGVKFLAIFPLFVYCFHLLFLGETERWEAHGSASFRDGVFLLMIWVLDTPNVSGSEQSPFQKWLHFIIMEISVKNKNYLPVLLGGGGRNQLHSRCLF